ncbi:uncharacterized protein YlxW (UPF0749 family) [Mumia flava]|uniref:Uncharacterized protein YlxW (UPF0749 family) n=1 Tax=Mumia flava TaxID=1348852 RepID=A0A0B2B1S4_9ACTN|nr:DUF881 domain-containing protein [Mumia flava]PJJ57613.1 uncharacterized protein YlxW (UPF0749 family) [Mumia flava]
MSDTEDPDRRRRTPWSFAVPVVMLAAGGLFAMSAVNADGTDLRDDDVDLPTLVQERRSKVDSEQQVIDDLRSQIDDLTQEVDNERIDDVRAEADALRSGAGFTEVTGPGLQVALDDAPREVEVSGLDPNLLVVHQQDIQAFVNALWAGGAEAITLQGQRLISTTGIKCVGNTVILDGVPYSPPYVIEAVGNPTTLYTALGRSQAVDIYRDYVEEYQLGLDITTRSQVVAPAYSTSVDLQYAQRLG